jgi:hypothetical protein
MPNKPPVLSQTSRSPFRLEILLTPHETKPRLRVHIALDVQRGPQAFGTAEEHTSLGRRVDFADRLEDHVPVGAAKVCGSAQAGDGILFGVRIVDHDVGCVVGFDLGGEVLFRTLATISRHKYRQRGDTYSVNLNMVIDILCFNRQQQRAEPLKGPEIPANPEEVHFPQTRAALRVVHAVPDALEDGREGGDTNTGAISSLLSLFSPFSPAGFLSMLQPSALPTERVKSPTMRMWIEM